MVNTVLTAAAQIPDVHIWFGPDTYMGENLAHLWRALGEMDDETIRALHPEHDRESIRAFGIDVTSELCGRLLERGAPGLHFYSMNQYGALEAIWKNLGEANGVADVAPG